LPEHDPVIVAVARAVGLAEGPRGVQAIVDALARLEPTSIRIIGRTVDLPVPIVAAVCGELRKHGLVAEQRPAQLTVAGRTRFARTALDIDPRCPGCGGRGIALPKDVARLRRGLARVAGTAPEPLVEIDQCHCTPKTKLRRVLALHATGAIVGRRVLLLGDDDLLTVTLARFIQQFGASETIAELVVVDCDERLLEFIGIELDGTGVTAQLVRHDLRDPLPSALRRRFDTVATDPPYTPAGARLFLSRAVEALAGEGANVFLSFGSRRPGAQFDLQQVIATLGLEIRALTRDFNDYVGAGVLGGTSHLYHLAATATTRPVIDGRYDEPIYTAARRRTDATPSTSRRPARRSGAAP
jgi:N4-bis(aminopropyl)spermidine synthase